MLTRVCRSGAWGFNSAADTTLARQAEPEVAIPDRVGERVFHTVSWRTPGASHRERARGHPHRVTGAGVRDLRRFGERLQRRFLAAAASAASNAGSTGHRVLTWCPRDRVRPTACSGGCCDVLPGVPLAQSASAVLIARAVSRTHPPHSGTRAGSNRMSGMEIATAATGSPERSATAAPTAQTCARFSEMLTA